MGDFTGIIYSFYLQLVGKFVVNFLSVIIEYFSPGLTARTTTRALYATSRYRRLLKWMGHLKTKFYVKDVRFEPTSVDL